MKRLIPRRDLRAFAREFLRLDGLLSEPDEVAELDRFLTLVRSMEKSGGIAALETLLRPQQTGSAAPLKDTPRPISAPAAHVTHKRNT
jgi:hypothetical protein